MEATVSKSIPYVWTGGRGEGVCIGIFSELSTYTLNHPRHSRCSGAQTQPIVSSYLHGQYFFITAIQREIRLPRNSGC
ncbi:hypothetical protein J6590_051326 [Homalodisca vitripennis]|nr:hypothetical protein J6590_051326 [Homalodisca vitripennis]